MAISQSRDRSYSKSFIHEMACSPTILAVRKDKALLLTYWASPEGTKSYAKALDEIMKNTKGIR